MCKEQYVIMIKRIVHKFSPNKIEKTKIFSEPEIIEHIKNEENEDIFNDFCNLMIDCFIKDLHKNNISIDSSLGFIKLFNDFLHQFKWFVDIENYIYSNSLSYEYHSSKLYKDNLEHHKTIESMILLVQKSLNNILSSIQRETDNLFDTLKGHSDRLSSIDYQDGKFLRLLGIYPYPKDSFDYTSTDVQVCFDDIDDGVHLVVRTKPFKRFSSKAKNNFMIINQWAKNQSYWEIKQSCEPKIFKAKCTISFSKKLRA